MEKSTCHYPYKRTRDGASRDMEIQGRAFRSMIGLKRGRSMTAIRVEPRVNSRPYALRIGTGVFCLPKEMTGKREFPSLKLSKPF